LPAKRHDEGAAGIRTPGFTKSIFGKEFTRDRVKRDGEQEACDRLCRSVTRRLQNVQLRIGKYGFVDCFRTVSSFRQARA
jgi:hypothetical protein